MVKKCGIKSRSGWKSDIFWKLSRVGCYVAFMAVLALPAMAQKEERIQLERAGELVGGKYNGEQVSKFRGNVLFRQKEMYLYCDSAFQYQNKKLGLDAFGHVKIVQGDSLTITGNTLHYEPESKNAILRGNVVMVDKGTLLRTEVLDYNLGTKVASYTTGGTLRDAKSVLTSVKGRFDSHNKMFYFRDKVKVVGPDGTLLTDTLDYNTETKIAYFRGPSEMLKIDGSVFANRGEYHTGEAITRLMGRARVESGSYLITGDQMYNDEKRRISIIKNNVKITSLKDSITIEGDMAHYWGGQGISKIFGNAIMKNYSEADTLYLTADTLLSVDNNIPSQKKLLGYNNARIYRTDLQGKCDSLSYSFKDSTIYFFRDPVLWNEGSQILADSINIQMANRKIDKLNMNINSFIISIDSLKNYNQVKGRRMTAYFKDNSIQNVDVNGNGESIYFALDGDSVLVGMNKVECSDILIKFESNKVNAITFLKKPDAMFIPPHEIQEPDTRLKGFRWRIKERPTLEEVMATRTPKKG